MFGKTYSLFQIAEQQLSDQKLKWRALQNNARMKNPKIQKVAAGNLAQRIEAVLCWERNEWYELALQAQSNADKMILGDLKRLAERAQEAQKQDPSDVESN